MIATEISEPGSRILDLVEYEYGEQIGNDTTVQLDFGMLKRSSQLLGRKDKEPIFFHFSSHLLLCFYTEKRERVMS